MPINIPLIDGYKLSSDKYQFILKERNGTRVNKKTGEEEERWDSVSFHKDIPSALVVVQRRYLHKMGATTFEELSMHYTMLTRAITAIKDTLDRVSL